MGSHHPARQAPPLPESGFSLIELLVAAATFAVVLAGAYGWVWSLGSLAGTQDDRAQASTIAAALTRTVSEDVSTAVGMVPPAAGRDPVCALSLVHDPVDGSPENVAVVWDAARRVVWRNASGTYVADHVRAFRAGFVLEDGRTVDGAAMSAADWQGVRAVRITLAVEVGAATARRNVLIGLGPL
jgi:prepilin-type N-terminal cleavage/methylation domain-containing protein